MFAKKQMPIFAYRYDLQVYRLYVEYGEEMGTPFFVNTDLHYMGTEYGVSSHYVTVTGIVYNVNVSGEYTTMLEISNWGEKMYLDYSAYIEYVEDGLNDLDNSFKDVVFTQFGNGILYIH